MPLSREDLREIREILGREPRQEELAMFEAQWSEHCSYRSSRKLLELLPCESRRVRILVGRGRDAPAVELFPGIAVVFKIESHNHPSAVDPYNGAATGIGGIVRDILTLGAKPIALLDMLYLGDPRDPYARWLIRGIVKGISDYGNRIGVPTIGGDTWFDRSFNTQPLVNVACVGIVTTDKLESVLRAPRPGDLIVIMGNATGRDGILGSSFASKPLSDSPSSDIAAVQVGDPLMEKLIIDALQVLVEKRLVKLIKDLGGGGLTTALSEIAADYGLGVDVFLDRLHLRQELTPLEILVSESQERMLLVVEPDRLREVEEVLSKYEVPYSVIGFFTSSGRIRAFYGTELVADVPAKELAKPRTIRRESRPPLEALRGLMRVDVPEPRDLVEVFAKLVSSPNIASKRWIYQQYDHEVGIRTVIKPGWGDAAVLRLLDSTRRGLAVKGDANPRYTSIDPFNGAANCVAECFRNLVSVGAEPIAIVDELNAGNPEKPEHFWYFEQMLKGVAWMAEELELPVVGGKVSFYNEDSRGRQVKPTTTIVGVGRVDEVSKVTTMDLKRSDTLIAVIGITYPELGGSEYLYAIYGLELGEIPKPRPLLELRAAKLVRTLIDRGIALSVHDIGSGGLGVAVAEMAILGGVGVELDVSLVPTRGVERIDEVLFSETQARYVVEIPIEARSEFEKLVRGAGVTAAIVGKTIDRNELRIVKRGKSVAVVDLSMLRDLYMNTLERAIEE